MGITAFIWTAGISKITALSTVLGPLTVVFFRFLIGLILFTIVKSALGIKDVITKTDKKRLMISGILCSLIYFGVSNLAYSYLPIVDSAALSSMQLIFMLWGESVVLGKIVTPKKTFLIVLATIGGILVMRAVSLSPESIAAYSIALVATSIWVGYCIYQLPLLSKYHLVTVVKEQMLYGSAVTLPFVFIETNHFELMSTAQWHNILFLGILGLSLGYFLNAFALKHIGPTNTSLLLILQPIIILFSDFYWQGRTLIWSDYIGVLLIGIGMLGVMHDMNREKFEYDYTTEEVGV